MYTYNIDIYNSNKYNLYMKYNQGVAFEINAINSLYNLSFWPVHRSTAVLLKLLMI